jgi:hypothetical protein
VFVVRRVAVLWARLLVLHHPSDIELSVRFFFGTRREADLDKFNKLWQDALRHLYADDSQIREAAPGSELRSQEAAHRNHGAPDEKNPAASSGEETSAGSSLTVHNAEEGADCLRCWLEW